MAYEDGGEVPFMRGAAAGSRVDRPGSAPSMDEIDMLLPGRFVVDKAGNSRAPENGGGGGGARDVEICALYCGEGGSMGRPLNGGGGGGGGGGGLSCATREVMQISKARDGIQKSVEKGGAKIRSPYERKVKGQVISYDKHLPPYILGELLRCSG